MSEPVSATYGYLLAQYGPLLTLQHLAEVMHTTPNGVRMALARQRQPLAVALAGARQRLGRRVYFEARRVAAVIDQGASSISGALPALDERAGFTTGAAFPHASDRAGTCGAQAQDSRGMAEGALREGNERVENGEEPWTSIFLA